MLSHGSYVNYYSIAGIKGRACILIVLQAKYLKHWFGNKKLANITSVCRECQALLPIIILQSIIRKE